MKESEHCVDMKLAVWHASWAQAGPYEVMIELTAGVEGEKVMNVLHRLCQRLNAVSMFGSR